MLRQDLERRNRQLYSWNQALTFKGISKGDTSSDSFPNIGISMERLGQMVKAEWPLLLAALFLLTGLSLVSFQVFMVVVSLMALSLTVIMFQPILQFCHTLSQGAPSDNQKEDSLTNPLFEENRPRFIPLTQPSRSETSRISLQRTPHPRHYRQSLSREVHQPGTDQNQVS